jgi:hypothetical protein
MQQLEPHCLLLLLAALSKLSSTQLPGRTMPPKDLFPGYFFLPLNATVLSPSLSMSPTVSMPRIPLVMALLWLCVSANLVVEKGQCMSLGLAR